MSDEQEWDVLPMEPEGYDSEMVVGQINFAPKGQQWPRVTATVLRDENGGTLFSPGYSVVLTHKASPDDWRFELGTRIPSECVMAFSQFIVECARMVEDEGRERRERQDRG